MLDPAVILFALLLAGLGVLLYFAVAESRLDRMARRLRDLAGPPTEAAPQGEAGAGVRSLYGKVMDLLAGVGRIPLADARQRRKIGTLLVIAGFRQPHHLPLFFAVKFGCGALGAAAGAYLALVNTDSFLLRAMVVMGMTFAAMVLPEQALSTLAKRRQKAINAHLPDALDLLVICTNAGYGLGASLQRVAVEMIEISQPLADELKLTSDELQIRSDPAEALRRMADRVRTDALRSLAVTLIQTQKYGTPITQTLKTLARAERTARMLALEERAAKLSVKLTIPMMVFILPTVVIVAAGPAGIRLWDALHTLIPGGGN